MLFRKLWLKKDKDEQEPGEETEKYSLKMLLKNVNPNLACEIKECWIDPDAISLGNFLGRGKQYLLMYLCMHLCMPKI